MICFQDDDPETIQERVNEVCLAVQSCKALQSSSKGGELWQVLEENSRLRSENEALRVCD